MYDVQIQCSRWKNFKKKFEEKAFVLRPPFPKFLKHWVAYSMAKPTLVTLRYILLPGKENNSTRRAGI